MSLKFIQTRFWLLFVYGDLVKTMSFIAKTSFDAFTCIVCFWKVPAVLAAYMQSNIISKVIGSSKKSSIPDNFQLIWVILGSNHGLTHSLDTKLFWWQNWPVKIYFCWKYDRRRACISVTSYPGFPKYF